MAKEKKSATDDQASAPKGASGGDTAPDQAFLAAAVEAAVDGSDAIAVPDGMEDWQVARALASVGLRSTGLAGGIVTVERIKD